jgi:CMP/dCMP kinase
MKKITIAIDGHSSTGKSTLAKKIAKHLNYIYVDTGAMYRAVTLFAMEHNLVTPTEVNATGLIALLDQVELQFITNDVGLAEMYLNNVNVEKAIRNMDVSNCVSQVATVSQVRAKLVEQQQKMGLEKGIVMDGRDIGTVVFPFAELKLFMTASAETRAKRRYNELLERGDDITYEAVYKNVVERDEIDSTRAESPLLQAEDAIAIDNSNMTRVEQFNVVLDLVNQTLKAN